MFEYNYEISTTAELMVFTKEHDECYGGSRTTTLDTEGKTGRALYNHIKKHCGAVFASEARLQGYCPH